MEYLKGYLKEELGDAGDSSWRYKACLEELHDLRLERATWALLFQLELDYFTYQQGDNFEGSLEEEELSNWEGLQHAHLTEKQLIDHMFQYSPSLRRLRVSQLPFSLSLLPSLSSPFAAALRD